MSGVSKAGGEGARVPPPNGAGAQVDAARSSSRCVYDGWSVRFWAAPGRLREQISGLLKRDQRRTVRLAE